MESISKCMGIVSMYKPNLTILEFNKSLCTGAQADGPHLNDHSFNNHMDLQQ